MKDILYVREEDLFSGRWGGGGQFNDRLNGSKTTKSTTSTFTQFFRDARYITIMFMAMDSQDKIYSNKHETFITDQHPRVHHNEFA